MHVVTKDVTLQNTTMMVVIVARRLATATIAVTTVTTVKIPTKTRPNAMSDCILVTSVMDTVMEAGVLSTLQAVTGTVEIVAPTRVSPAVLQMRTSTITTTVVTRVVSVVHTTAATRTRPILIVVRLTRLDWETETVTVVEITTLPTVVGTAVIVATALARHQL